MAKPQTVQVYPCDGCGYLVPAPKSSDRPKGFYGTAEEVHPDGNAGPVEYYAHLDRCIKQAVLNVLGI